ncbi:MAG: hypothetical protein MJ237_08985 [bacterium]|nr:hypothetical protein [bacterium]
MNNDNLLIDMSDIKDARLICNGIDDDLKRQRAVANVLAAKLAKEYFGGVHLDIESGIHNVYQVLSGFDISDIYLNNHYINVRVHFCDNDLCISQKDFELEITPEAYMFVKIDTNNEYASVTGFILPENIDLSNKHDDYYFVDASMLVPFENIEDRFAQNVAEYTSANLDDLDEIMFDYLDNKPCDVKTLFSSLLASAEFRNSFIKAAKAKEIFCFISLTDSNNDENFENDLSELNTDDEFLQQDDEDFSLFSDDEINQEQTEQIGFDDNMVVTDDIELDDTEADEIVFNKEDNSDILETADSISQTEEDSYQYVTDTTPSIDMISEKDTPVSSEEELIESLLSEQDSMNSSNNVTTNANQAISGEKEIESLFNENGSNVVTTSSPQKKNAIFPILGLSVLISAIGYYSYTKFVVGDTKPYTETVSETINNIKTNENNKNNVAMPLETVANIPVANPVNSNEGNSVEVPAIEQNLDASILISNLSINWEVPAGYAANNTAKRYFTRIGKILQLNLKSDLLLATKPPITNKIMVELEFNKNLHKFEIKDITASSGEVVIDDIVKHTVEDVLSYNLNTNMNVFNNISGNPVLIIKL